VNCWLDAFDLQKIAFSSVVTMLEFGLMEGGHDRILASDGIRMTVRVSYRLIMNWGYA